MCLLTPQMNIALAWIPLQSTLELCQTQISSSACCTVLLLAICGATHAAVNDSLAHFVTRNGSQLQVNGHPFHFAGVLHACCCAILQRHD